MTEEIERPNQQKIRTIRAKERYIYLGLLEVETIKHAKMKEKRKKNPSVERENYSNPNSIADISWKR